MANGFPLRVSKRADISTGKAWCVRLCAIALALLLLGFWRTLFIAVFAALGALAGGIGNKRDAVRVAINRSFPPKDKPLDIEQDTQDKTNKPE